MFRSITGLIAKVAGLGPATGRKTHLHLVPSLTQRPSGPPSRPGPDARGENIVDLQHWAGHRRGTGRGAAVNLPAGQRGRVLVARGGWCARVGLPDGVAARLPCGADLKLLENVLRTGTGQPRSRQLIATFKDPDCLERCGWGSFDFDAVFTPGMVDLRNVFNNSLQPGALDFAVWHMARAGGTAAVFRISGVEEEALRLACEAHYGLMRTATGCTALNGDAAAVAKRARQRLLDKGWALRE